MYNLKRDVLRVNIKTMERKDGYTVEDLRRYCLKDRPKDQCLAIGWSDVYEKSDDEITDYDEYYSAVKKIHKRLNHAHNAFKEVEEDDLLWTRDEDSIYWICRATGKAKAGVEICNSGLDIGAIVPVEAYKVGTEVPGQIKGSFNQRWSGVVGTIRSELIREYSKHAYNVASGEDFYEVDKTKGKDFLKNLPDFELEELVISYLQIEKNLYLLSNSIAFGSSTAKIECELMPRDDCGQKAVVQVKGPGFTDKLKACDYQEYARSGYVVYFYCPEGTYDDEGVDTDCKDSFVQIKEKDLEDFVNMKRHLLPENIMKFEDIFALPIAKAKEVSG